jgi:hypothetical protein
MSTINLPMIRPTMPAWNKGRIVGQKRPLLPKHVWAIRVRLELAEAVRDLALFNLAIDSKLRGCDLVRLKVADVFAAGQVKERTSILQSKTKPRYSLKSPTEHVVRSGTGSRVRRCTDRNISGPVVSMIDRTFPRANTEDC